MATVTMHNARKNYRTVVGHSPSEYDMAIVSIDLAGTYGELNRYVLEEYGYEFLVVGEENLAKGYHLLRELNKKPILFIVTVTSEYTGINLKRNLTEALTANYDFLKSKNIWIPLMGTGSGGLDFVDSYDTTLGVIKGFPEIFFNISIPNDKRGLAFLEQFKPEMEDFENSSEVINDVGEEVNYFLAGHIWGGNDDQMSRFISDEIWENGHERNDTEVVGLAKPGDIVFLKSTFAYGDTSYLRIKAIGVVRQNFNNGHLLSVNWHVFGSHVDFENLGSYRRTFAQVRDSDIQEILEGLAENFQDFYDVLNQLTIDPSSGQSTISNEVFIDTNGRFVYGQEVGQEIIEYDLIFLPKSSFGGVGNNSIATHILNLLGVDKDSLEFSDENLLKHKYAIHIVQSKELNKTFYLIFIVTRDESKNHIPFAKQFIEAIDNLRKSEDFHGISGPLNAFVPFLGTGQAGMPVNESFMELLPGLGQLDKTINPQKIRINYPRKLDIESIANFNEKLLDALGLEPFEDVVNSGSVVPSRDEDKIPFHLDNVESVDRLNREPVAKSLARLINNEIFGNESLQHSFMIHLQGEWGSGKSTFLNLIKNHLESDKQKWVIVNFDSWQNQHINPPWWSFIDQVYRQARTRIKGPCLWIRENTRRIIWYSGWHKIMSLFFSIILFWILIKFGGAMFERIAELPAADNIDNSVKGLTLDIFAKLIVSVGSIVGLVYSLSKFLSTPFLMRSSGEAKSFLLRASDPMNRIKKHYNRLIDNINKEGYNIAVFIDDIDRCDRSYTIGLLEGIQTLFREKKVLFIVAGDKNWISTCFENNYEEFIGKVNKSNEKLGDLFLEKVFQLSFRMPNVSEETKKMYWHHILGFDEGSTSNKEELELSGEQREAVKQKVKLNYAVDNQTKSTFFKGLEEEYQLSEKQVSDIAIEALDESKDDIRHFFADHYNLINPNPRAIKRLANNYTMYRNTMIAERKDFNPNKLFRWLIVDDLYPKLTREIVKKVDGDNIADTAEKMNLDREAMAQLEILLFDKDNKHGGPLEVSDIKDILGI